jgi:hypothetical protein
MMEYWNNGFKNNQVFILAHYSIHPVFHHSMGLITGLFSRAEPLHIQDFPLEVH